MPLIIIFIINSIKQLIFFIFESSGNFVDESQLNCAGRAHDLSMILRISINV